MSQDPVAPVAWRSGAFSANGEALARRASRLA
jgi:hypothetical protein